MRVPVFMRAAQILTINAVAGNRFTMAGWTQPGRGQERRADAAANPGLRQSIAASFQKWRLWVGRLRATDVHGPGVAGAVWRTRERNSERELRPSNLFAKLLNLEIGFCNVDRHKCDLDQGVPK